MQTLTLRLQDDYLSQVLSLLATLPKDAVIIEPVQTLSRKQALEQLDEVFGSFSEYANAPVSIEKMQQDIGEHLQQQWRGND